MVYLAVLLNSLDFPIVLLVNLQDVQHQRASEMTNIFTPSCKVAAVRPHKVPKLNKLKN